jgi:MFS family permease
MAVGRLFGDPFVRKFGSRRMVAFGGVSAAVGVVIAVSTSSVVICIAGLSFACAGISNIVPTLITEAGKVPDLPEGTGVAAVTTIAYGGFLVGPPIIGLVAHRSSLSLGLALLAILGVLLAVASSYVSPTARASS